MGVWAREVGCGRWECLTRWVLGLMWAGEAGQQKARLPRLSHVGLVRWDLVGLASGEYQNSFFFVASVGGFAQTMCPFWMVALVLWSPVGSWVLWLGRAVGIVLPGET